MNNDLTPSKIQITENDESRQFSELKGSDPSKYKIPKSMNFEQLFNDLMNMEHRQLVDYCIELKSKDYRSKSREKPRASSAVRSSHPC